MSTLGVVFTNLALLALGILIAALYMLPTILAKRRRVRGFAQVVIVNVAFGWTGVGWIVALIMAYREPLPVIPPPGPAQSVIRQPQPDPRD
jgi:hypothetical protein